MKNKKTILIVCACIAVVIIASKIVWNATADTRYIKRQMNEVLDEISEYRNGESDSIHIFVGASASEDPEFIDFLSSQISEMVTNSEYSLLGKFLSQLEFRDVKNAKIQDAFTNSCVDTENLDTILKIAAEIKNLDYYKAYSNLNRNSDLFVSYIDTNGTEDITTTPGKGYYASKRDSHSFHRVGLSTSPLYDAEDITYRGDFMEIKRYGVRLNSYYEETSYSNVIYRFRDNVIDFSPDDGECVYSGDYLFCFSTNGNLRNFAEIRKK